MGKINPLIGLSKKTNVTTTNIEVNTHVCIEKNMHVYVVNTEILPTIPNSSASQLHKMIVLLGFHPEPNKTENRRATSSRAAVPLLGSTAPYVHASLWFPSRT